VKVDVVIPVYNEECKLERCIHALRQHLLQHPRYDWRIVIADNASVDRTWTIAQGLSSRFPEVAALHLDQKGRGLALRAAWTASTAEIVSYMDVDLSTDLAAFVPMIDSLAQGRCDVAVGSRLSRGSQVERCLKREVVSRGYNLLVAAFFPGKQFTDAQIGFKALTLAAAREVLPLVQNNYWFFDTELLVQAQRRGYRIGNIPVRWTEDRDSRVKVGPAAMENIKGLVRLRFQKAA
jgi:glycosyltransferase involved in cell wall biosynthesis